MTVHTEEQPEPAGVRAAARTAHGDPHTSGSATRPRATKAKVLAVLLAAMTGIAAALAAYILGNRVTATSAEPIAWAAATFVATTSLAIHLGEKAGLLE